MEVAEEGERYKGLDLLKIFQSALNPRFSRTLDFWLSGHLDYSLTVKPDSV